MRRIPILVVVLIGGLSSCGCASLSWLRAVGHYPGVAPSDYAYYNYFGISSQLFPYSVSQVESSTIESIGDLGFKIVDKPTHSSDGIIEIEAATPDGRSARVTLTPQNNLTNMRIAIGPKCVGDEMLSRDVFKRVALNFGAIPRSYTPMEPVLSRHIRASAGIRQAISPVSPEALEGEGLRPGESRGTIEGEEGVPGLESTPLPNSLNPFMSTQPFTPTRDDPNPPNLPYAPFPYSPYEANP
jgi:hypothetical protein